MEAELRHMPVGRNPSFQKFDTQIGGRIGQKQKWSHALLI